MFSKTLTKLLPSETLNLECVNENFFGNNDILYIVEKVLKSVKSVEYNIN